MQVSFAFNTMKKYRFRQKLYIRSKKSVKYVNFWKYIENGKDPLFFRVFCVFSARLCVCFGFFVYSEWCKKQSGLVDVTQKNFVFFFYIQLFDISRKTAHKM